MVQLVTPMDLTSPDNVSHHHDGLVEYRTVLPDILMTPHDNFFSGKIPAAHFSYPPSYKLFRNNSEQAKVDNQLTQSLKRRTVQICYKSINLAVTVKSLGKKFLLDTRFHA